MKKRVVALFALFTLSVFLISTFVSAADPTATVTPADVQEGVSTAKEYLSAFLTPIFASFFGEKELFSRVLLAILLFMIVYEVIDFAFKMEGWTRKLISVIVTILGILVIPPEFVTLIRDNFGVMGAAILTIIPFLIVLAFSIRMGGGVMARAVWAIYALYYLIIYFYKWINSTNPWWSSPALIPYLLAMIVGIIMFWVIKPIRNAVFKGNMREIEEEGEKIVRRAGTLHKLQRHELTESYGAGGE